MVPPRHTHLLSVLTFWWFQFSTTRVDGSRLLPNGLVWKPLPFFTSNASRLDLKENCSRWKLPLTLQSIFIYLYKKKLGWMRHISQWAMGHNIWPKQKQSLSEMTATQTRSMILLQLWVGGNLKISTRSSGLHFCVTSTLKPCDPRRSPVTEEEEKESCILAIRILIDTLDLTFRWEVKIFTEWDNLSWGQDVGRRLNCREATRYGRSM